jgi:hypothetical protein
MVLQFLKSKFTKLKILHINDFKQPQIVLKTNRINK